MVGCKLISLPLDHIISLRQWKFSSSGRVTNLPPFFSTHSILFPCMRKTEKLSMHATYSQSFSPTVYKVIMPWTSLGLTLSYPGNRGDTFLCAIWERELRNVFTYSREYEVTNKPITKCISGSLYKLFIFKRALTVQKPGQKWWNV